MTITDINALPPADAEQQHLVDEIEHPDFVEAVHHDFAHRCGACGQPMPEEAGR